MGCIRRGVIERRSGATGQKANRQGCQEFSVKAVHGDSSLRRPPFSVKVPAGAGGRPDFIDQFGPAMAVAMPWQTRQNPQSQLLRFQ
jgi:hypothetical protein